MGPRSLLLPPAGSRKKIAASLTPDPASARSCAAGGPRNVVTHYLIGMAQAAGGGSSGLMQIAPLVLIFAIFYFLVIRPQSKKAKEHQQMLTELKKGDDVVTQGGIIGTHHRHQGRRGHAAGPGGRAPAHAPQLDHRPAQAARREAGREVVREPQRRQSLRNPIARFNSWNAPGGGRRLSTVSSPCWPCLYLVPTVAPDSKNPALEFVNKHFQKRIQLGLDLQGGLHLVYEVNVDKAVVEQGRPPRVRHRGSPAQGQGRERPHGHARGARRHHLHLQEARGAGQARRRDPARLPQVARPRRAQRRRPASCGCASTPIRSTRCATTRSARASRRSAAASTSSASPSRRSSRRAPTSSSSCPA